MDIKSKSVNEQYTMIKTALAAFATVVWQFSKVGKPAHPDRNRTLFFYLNTSLQGAIARIFYELR